MFSSRRSNILINQIQERSLKTVYDYTSSIFQELLKGNTQTLTMEVFKVVNNICPPIIRTSFGFRKTDSASENFNK